MIRIIRKRYSEPHPTYRAKVMDTAGESSRYRVLFFLPPEKRADKMFNGVANVPICVNRSSCARERIHDTRWAVRINNARVGYHPLTRGDPLVRSAWHLLRSYLCERKPRYFDNTLDDDSRRRRDSAGDSRANYRDLFRGARLIAPFDRRRRGGSKLYVYNKLNVKYEYKYN